jgi:hypothetical protein
MHLSVDQFEPSEKSASQRPLFRSWAEVLRSLLFAFLNFILGLSIVFLLVGGERWAQLDRSGLYTALGFMAILWELGPLTHRPPATCQPMAFRIVNWVAALFIILVAGSIIAFAHPQWLFTPRP